MYTYLSCYLYIYIYHVIYIMLDIQCYIYKHIYHVIYNVIYTYIYISLYIMYIMCIYIHIIISYIAKQKQKNSQSYTHPAINKTCSVKNWVRTKNLFGRHSHYWYPHNEYNPCVVPNLTHERSAPEPRTMITRHMRQFFPLPGAPITSTWQIGGSSH